MKNTPKRRKRNFTKGRVDATWLKRNFVVLLLSQTKESIVSSSFEKFKEDFYSYDFVRKTIQNVVNVVCENIKNGNKKEVFLTYENLKDIVSLRVFKSLPISQIEEFNIDFLLLSKSNFLLSLNAKLNTSTSKKFLLTLKGVIEEKLVKDNLTEREVTSLNKMKNKISFILSLKEGKRRKNLCVYFNNEPYISYENLEKALRYKWFGKALEKYFKTQVTTIKKEIIDENNVLKTVLFIRYKDVLNFLENHYIKDEKLTPISLEEIPYFYTYKEIVEVFEQKRIGVVLLRQISYFKMSLETTYESIKKTTGRALYRADDIYDFINKIGVYHKPEWVDHKTEKLNELIVSSL